MGNPPTAKLPCETKPAKPGEAHVPLSEAGSADLQAVLAFVARPVQAKDGFHEWNRNYGYHCTELLVAMPFAPSSVLALSSKARSAPSCFMLLVVMPFALSDAKSP